VKHRAKSKDGSGKIINSLAAMETRWSKTFATLFA
jgi:hypothetical protein